MTTSRILPDQMTTLVSAATARTVAATALDDAQLQAIAFAINSAANTNEYRVQFQQRIRPAVKQELISKGYQLKQLTNPANIEDAVIISWEEE